MVIITNPHIDFLIRAFSMLLIIISAFLMLLIIEKLKKLIDVYGKDIKNFFRKDKKEKKVEEVIITDKKDFTVCSNGCNFNKQLLDEYAIHMRQLLVEDIRLIFEECKGKKELKFASEDKIVVNKESGEYTNERDREIQQSESKKNINSISKEVTEEEHIRAIIKSLNGAIISNQNYLENYILNNNLEEFGLINDKEYTFELFSGGSFLGYHKNEHSYYIFPNYKSQKPFNLSYASSIDIVKRDCSPQKPLTLANLEILEPGLITINGNGSSYKLKKKIKANLYSNDSFRFIL